MVVFYKKINKKNEECECCHKQGARYKVVRWVKPGEWSFVAGVNIAPSYYCSKDCMKTVESAKRPKGSSGYVLTEEPQMELND